MADHFSGLRCRPGDLAVIVQDEPECRANIGQVVRILSEYTPFREEPVFYWLVKPLSSQLSAVLIGSPGSASSKLVYDNEPRGHQDAWLRPLLDTEEPDDISRIADRSDESEWRDPVHLRVNSGSLA